MANSVQSIGLFAGVGMLDQGFALACEYLGWAHRCVGYVERDAYAASILMARMEESALECAPVFCGDIQDVDGREWRGRENLWLVGGFPCQDISVAGKGAGIIEGKRSGLWREYARLIEESECAGVFIENVSALVHRGLDVVLADLARLGFDAVWGSFRASDVGAPHRRERVFILAYRPGDRGQQPAGEGQGAHEAGAQEVRGRGVRAEQRPTDDEQLELRRVNVADSAQRGFGISGQSSGFNGQPDGGGQEVPAARVPEGAQRRNDERVLGATGGIREGARDCPGNDPMAYTEHAIGRAEHEKQPEPHRRDGLGRGSESLADTPDGVERVGLGECATAETGAEPRPEGLCEGLGHAGEPGRQGRQLSKAFGARTGPSRPTGESNLAAFPPGPSDRATWAAILARNASLAPALPKPPVCRMVDGLADRLDGGVENGREEKTSRRDIQGGYQQTSPAERFAAWRKMLRLRLDKFFGKASPELLKAGGRGYSLSPVPPETGQGRQDVDRELGQRIEVRDLWSNFSAAEAQALEDLFEFGVSGRDGEDQCAKALEYRTDRLRCTGNGVVALQAAYAACVLAERAGLVMRATT